MNRYQIAEIIIKYDIYTRYLSYFRKEKIEEVLNDLEDKNDIVSVIQDYFKLDPKEVNKIRLLINTKNTDYNYLSKAIKEYLSYYHNFKPPAKTP